MKDEPIERNLENIPDYNRATAQRRTWSFSIRTPDDIDGFYSPFWPLLIVFISFIVLLVYEINVLRYRTLVLRNESTQQVDLMQKAKDQEAFIESFHQDLQTLAPTHPTAAAILTDFFPQTPSDSGKASK